MTIIHSLEQMRGAAREARASGRRIGVVPTMGFLHEGHLSLVSRIRDRCDTVVMTLFVNPAQFAPSEDLETYPRNFERDAALAQESGVDILFAPDAVGMYPQGFETFVIPGPMGGMLEAGTRPDHFRGVLTVVAKLFHLVDPDVAVFGQKDLQQALLIQRMVRDLDFDIEVLVAPIVREADGLAMSSRNVYLSPDERTQARALSESLAEASARIAEGERSPAILLNLIETRIALEPAAKMDYVVVVNPETLENLDHLVPGISIAIVMAVYVGKTRLLDNAIVRVGATSKP